MAPERAPSSQASAAFASVVEVAARAVPCLTALALSMRHAFAAPVVGNDFLIFLSSRPL